MAMSRLQWLLGKLAEECSEVAKVALKAQQFGLNCDNEGRMLETNADYLAGELDDLWGIVELLNEEFNLRYSFSRKGIDQKKAKANRYYILSYRRGLVEPCAAAEV